MSTIFIYILKLLTLFTNIFYIYFFTEEYAEKIFKIHLIKFYGSGMKFKIAITLTPLSPGRTRRC